MERIWIANVPQRTGQLVRVSGFVNVVRDQKRMQFIILQDRTGTVQITREKRDDSLSSTISTLTPGSALSAIGRVVPAPNVKLGGVELLLEEIDKQTLASSPLPITPESSLEKQIDWRYLSLREPDNYLIFAVQTTLEHAMRLFWREHGFIEIHSPKLMGTFSESGAEVFKVDYFKERKAYLAQSPQFYKQMAIAAGFERVFEVGPAFRAEPSYTARHETEFTSLDMEVSWIDSHLDVMRLEEQWLVYALRMVLAEHGNAIRERFGVEIRVPETPFPSIPLEEALAILKQRGHNVGHKPDLDPEGERRICAYVNERYGHEFVWIVDYPASVRAFYHMRHLDRSDLTKGFDLLWKGVEVTTGAQREHRYDRLVQQAIERGLDLGALQDYLNSFKFGCPPHGGAGIGLARLLMVMLERPSIREVTFISRTPTRLTP